MSEIFSGLSSLARTAFFPLCSRYFAAKRFDSLFDDPQLLRIGKELGCDDFQVPQSIQFNAVAKTALIDEQVLAFIRENPEGVIVNLGCGFDTRFFRVDNGKISWYDLDLAEVVAVKKGFLAETQRYRYIGSSVLDFAWMKKINPKGKRVLLIAEALLMYFSEEEVKELFQQLQGYFSHPRLLVEVVSPRVVKHSASKQVFLQQENLAYRWGIEKSSKMEKWMKGLQVLEEWNMLDVLQRYPKRWRRYRVFYTLLPYLRNTVRIVEMGL